MSISKGPKSSHFTPPASNIKPAEKPKPAPEIKPQPLIEDKNVDKSKLTGEKDEKSNAPKLGALMENLGGDKPERGKKTGKGDEAKKDEKADNKPKTPQEQKKQLEGLKDQLKKAQASGDKAEIAKLEAEINKLEEAMKGTQPGATNPSGESNPGGGNSPGGGAPAGGESAGGGSPAGGSPGSGAPGGGSPAGGANEAGAGQGAGAGKEEVDQFIQKAAAAYGVNPTLLSEIARRESNFNTGDIPNNWDSNAKKGTPSKGMFQFIEPTFQSFMPQAKAANPQAWQGVSENWTDWKAQALTTAWAISAGKGSHWSTYKSALATAGGNPRGGGTAMA